MDPGASNRLECRDGRLQRSLHPAGLSQLSDRGRLAERHLHSCIRQVRRGEARGRRLGRFFHRGHRDGIRARGARARWRSFRAAHRQLDRARIQSGPARSRGLPHAPDASRAVFFLRRQYSERGAIRQGAVRGALARAAHLQHWHHPGRRSVVTPNRNYRICRGRAGWSAVREFSAADLRSAPRRSHLFPELQRPASRVLAFSKTFRAHHAGRFALFRGRLDHPLFRLVSAGRFHHLADLCQEFDARAARPRRTRSGRGLLPVPRATLFREKVRGPESRAQHHLQGHHVPAPSHLRFDYRAKPAAPASRFFAHAHA